MSATKHSPFSNGLDMKGAKTTNVGTTTDSADAVTKNYVHTQVGILVKADDG